MQTIDITSAPASLVSVKKQVEDAPDGQDAQQAVATPEQEADQAKKAKDIRATDQKELETIVTEGGFNFEQFKTWAVESGNHTGTMLEDYQDVPPDVARRLVKSKTGLLKGLAGMKAGAQ